MSERIPPKTRSVEAAAALLGVTRRTVERYIARGKLSAYKTHTGRVAVDEESISALIMPTPIDVAHSGSSPSAPVVDASYPQASRVGAIPVSGAHRDD